MLAALIFVAAWMLCLVLATALCAAARRGDKQVDPGRERALTPPAASVPEVSALEVTPEVSVGPLGGTAKADLDPQAGADLALQSG